MRYGDGFIDPGSVDFLEEAPAEQPWTAPTYDSQEPWSPPAVDYSEDARDERLWEPPVDTSMITEFDPGASYAEAPESEAPYQPPWQGVADFLGGVKNTVGQIADHPFFAPERGLGEAADLAVGPYARSHLGTATHDDVMEIGLDKSMPALSGFGIGAARRVAGKFIRKGLSIFDDAGKLVVEAADDAQADRFINNLNRDAVTDVSDEAIAANDALRNTAQAADGSVSDFFDPNAPEVLRATADDAAAQAQFDKRGGIVGMAKAPQVTPINIEHVPDGWSMARYRIDIPGKGEGIDLNISVVGDKAHIDWIGGEGYDSSNRFGASVIRATAEQVSKDFPGVKTVDGYRVGGSFSESNPRWGDNVDYDVMSETRNRKYDLATITRGRGPIVPGGGAGSAIESLDELEAARRGPLPPTSVDRFADETAARAGGEQTRFPGIERVGPGRFNDFEVPPQSPSRFAAEAGAEQPSLFDDIAQPTLPVGDGPSGLPFSWANADEVTRAGNEAASDAATFNARGGIAGIGDELPPDRGQLFPSERVPSASAGLPPVVGDGSVARGADEGLFPGPLFEGAPQTPGAAPDISKLPGADRLPTPVAELSRAMRSLEDIENAAAAAMSSDPEYAATLLAEADEMRRVVDGFRDALSTSVGARVSDDGAKAYAEFVEAVVPESGGAKQLGVDWTNPEKNVGSILQRVGGEIKDLPRSMRAAMSTLDISLALRQGLIPAIAHPGQWNEGMDAAAQALRSEEGYRLVEKAWKQIDSYDLAKRAGVAEMTIDNADQMKKVEYFQSELVENIPLFGRAAKASTRHATAFGNTTRFLIFDTYAKSWGLDDLMKHGKHVEAERMAKDLASFVNSTTGIGNLGSLEGLAGPLSRLFFAPRFFASRINNIAAPFVFAAQAALPAGVNVGVGGKTLLEGGGSWKMAGLAWRDMGAYYATMAATATLLVSQGADINLDSNSTDFMKLTVGDHHIDMTGGYSNVFRHLSQIGGGGKVTNKGKAVNLRDPKYGEQGTLDVIGQYGRSLLAPGVSNAVDLAAGNRDLTGEPQGVMGHIPTPLGLSEFFDAVITDVRDNPDLLDALGKGVGTGALGMLGFGVQTYNKGEKKQQVSTNPIDLWLAEVTGIGRPQTKKATQY